MTRDLKKEYLEFLNKVDRSTLMKNTRELLDLEFPQTFEAYHASAKRAYELLKEKKIPNAELLSFPADGKTVYQDKITPLGWKATKGKLTIINAPGIPEGTVVADYEKHPFQLIKGSVSVPEGGRIVRIITEEQMVAGENPKDALILCSPRFHHSAPFISHFIDMGAIGFITDYARNAEDAPDGIQWCNAHTEKGSWHVTKEDRDFIGFSITPTMGNTLRAAIAQSANSRGNVLVLLESDGIRYETDVNVVTALIPGKRKEEFWILAHLYEPLGNDNSSGVAAAMETARLIMEKGECEFSLRLIFGLEMYGFAAYASTRGENLSSQVVGAINYDAMYLHNNWYITLYCAAPGNPFYGNYIAQKCVEELKGMPLMPEVQYLASAPAMYLDDAFLGDSTTGVPTIWPYRAGKNFWHNSKQTIDYVEEEPFSAGCAFNTLLTYSILNPDKSFIESVPSLGESLLKEELAHLGDAAKDHFRRRFEIALQDLKNFGRFLEKNVVEKAAEDLTCRYGKMASKITKNLLPSSPWRDFAGKITPSRLTTGFPYDLAKVPFAKRQALIFDTFSTVLANMDGKRSLEELIRLAEYETRQTFSEMQIKEYVRKVLHLARYGYISTGDFRGLTRNDILQALRKAGIREGDNLCVHSSIGKLGFVEGGAATIFEALKEAVGPEGTFMTPAFSAPFAYLGGPNKNKKFTPYDKNDPGRIWTGELPRYMLGLSETFHTDHISHSWCIYGKNAFLFGSEQKLAQPPVGKDSPLMKMLEKGGKIVHLGNMVTSTTFLHAIEDFMDLPGIQDTLCMLQTPCCATPVAVPRNLPGCRNFYSGDEESIPFFLEAKKMGLSITKVNLGMDYIRVMDMKELWECGCRIAGENPFIFLHDEKECLACARVKGEYLGRKSLTK